jgi:hypothetical protein
MKRFEMSHPWSMRLNILSRVPGYKSTAAGLAAFGSGCVESKWSRGAPERPPHERRL